MRSLIRDTFLLPIATSVSVAACSTLPVEQEPGRSVATPSVTDDRPAADAPIGVYVLGTIHGNMLDQPKNSLRHFVAALYAYKPEIILTEVRPEHPGGIEGAIDGGPEQALVYAYAKQANAVIIPSDWFDDDYNRLSEKEDAAVTPALEAEIAPLFESFRAVVQSGTFEESQSARTQALIRARYEKLAKAGLKSSDQRNAAICKNLRRHSPRFSGRRVLVIFGLAHKYALDDCLKQAGLSTLAFEDWYDPAAAGRVEVLESFKQESLRNFKAAKRLLGQRLKKGFYKTDLENMKDKHSEFDQWIERTGALEAR